MQIGSAWKTRYTMNVTSRAQNITCSWKVVSNRPVRFDVYSGSEYCRTFVEHMITVPHLACFNAFVDVYLSNQQAFPLLWVFLLFYRRVASLSLKERLFEFQERRKTREVFFKFWFILIWLIFILYWNFYPLLCEISANVSCSTIYFKKCNYFLYYQI